MISRPTKRTLKELNLAKQFFTNKDSNHSQRLSENTNLKRINRQTPLPKYTSSSKVLTNLKEIAVSGESTLQGSTHKQLTPRRHSDMIGQNSSSLTQQSQSQQEFNQSDYTSSETTSVSQEEVRIYKRGKLVSAENWECLTFGKLEREEERDYESNWRMYDDEVENDPLMYMGLCGVINCDDESSNSSMWQNCSVDSPDMSDLDDLISLQCQSQPCKSKKRAQ